MQNRLLSFFQSSPKNEFFPIDNLPKDVKLNILSLLDTPADLNAMSKVSKKWKEIAGNETLWKKFGAHSQRDFIHDYYAAQKIAKKHSRIKVYFTGDDIYEYQKAFILALKNNTGFSYHDGNHYDAVFSKHLDYYFLLRDCNAHQETEDTSIKNIVLLYLTKQYESSHFKKILNINDNCINNINPKVYVDPQTLLLFMLPKTQAKKFKEIPLNVILTEDQLCLEDLSEKVAEKVDQIASLSLAREPKSSFFCNIL